MSALVATIAVAGVLAGGFVAALAVSCWALASAARADAAADERADAGVSMVPFGELPEAQGRRMMTISHRAIVIDTVQGTRHQIDANDFEGRN